MRGVRAFAADDFSPGFPGRHDYVVAILANRERYVRQLMPMLQAINGALLPTGSAPQPGHKLMPAQGVHPIFQALFAMSDEDIYIEHPLVDVTPVYYGVFEDNDPGRRMYAIVNHNNDIAEYWEWSDTDELSIDYTNDAYKLGINYVIYAMTH